MTNEELSAALYSMKYDVPPRGVATWNKRTRQSVERWIVYTERRIRSAGRPTHRPNILDRYAMPVLK